MDILNIGINEEAIWGMSKAQVKSSVSNHVISVNFTLLKLVQLSNTEVKKTFTIPVLYFNLTSNVNGLIRKKHESSND